MDKNPKTKNNLQSLGNLFNSIRGIQPIDQSKHNQTGHIIIHTLIK